MGRDRRARTLPLALAAATLAGPAFAQTAPGQSLTITPQARETRAPGLSEADRRALDLFSSQPGLSAARGLSIGKAFGPHDEDCVRAGGEVFCRQ